MPPTVSSSGQFIHQNKILFLFAIGIVGILINTTLVIPTSGCYNSTTLIKVWTNSTAVKIILDLIVAIILGIKVYILISHQHFNWTLITGIELFLVILTLILEIWAIFVATKAKEEIRRGFDFGGKSILRQARISIQSFKKRNSTNMYNLQDRS